MQSRWFRDEKNENPHKMKLCGLCTANQKVDRFFLLNSSFCFHPKQSASAWWSGAFPRWSARRMPRPNGRSEEQEAAVPESRRSAPLARILHLGRNFEEYLESLTLDCWTYYQLSKSTFEFAIQSHNYTSPISSWRKPKTPSSMPHLGSLRGAKLQRPRRYKWPQPEKCNRRRLHSFLGYWNGPHTNIT